MADKESSIYCSFKHKKNIFLFGFIMEELRQLNCLNQKFSMASAWGRNIAQKILTETNFLSLNVIANKVFQ